MKWIKTSGLLPIHGIEVLLFHDSKFQFICMGKYSSEFEVFEDSQTWDDVHGAPKYKVTEITHWMPLPEPPC